MSEIQVNYYLRFVVRDEFKLWIPYSMFSVQCSMLDVLFILKVNSAVKYSCAE